MNNKLVLYILFVSASLQPLAIKAFETETTETITTNNTAEPIGYDELDAIYQEQGGNSEEMVSSTQMPEWVVSLGLAVILKYLALKDFMNSSWDRIKQTIGRK